jgi:hypothetical protein
MSDIAMPSDTADLMIRAPSPAFFESEQGVDATSTLGTYNYPTDFILAPTAGSLSSVYNSVETGKPLHAFLLGEVIAIESSQGGTVKASQSAETQYATNFLQDGESKAAHSAMQAHIHSVRQRCAGSARRDALRDI